MIISNSKRFIFVHIPKTGGTSITHAIASTLCWNDVICGGTPYGEKISPHYRSQFGLWKHSRACQIKSVVGEAVWSDYFTFAFVRDPYDRMRSLYTYTEGLVRSSRRQRNLWFRRSERAKERLKWPFVNAYLLCSSFSEFIRHPLLHKDDVARPMFDYLSEDGKIIVDCIGKIEAMAADFSKIAPRIGSPGLNLRQQNSSRPEGDELERFYRDQSDYDYVYERYESDFVNFGYQKIELA